MNVHNKDQIAALRTQPTHSSYWTTQTPLQPRFAPLVGEHTTDVLIIGAGITGLSVADELLSRRNSGATDNLRVTLCDASVIGAGTSGASSGHLDAHPEMGPSELLNRLGADDARSFISMRMKAIDKIIKRCRGKMDVVSIPAFQFTEKEDDLPHLRHECSMAIELGLPATWADSIPHPRAVGGYRIAGLGRIDSLKYVSELADSVVERGGRIFEQTKVDGPSVEEPQSLSTGAGTVHFKHVVCAAHSNITNSLRLYLETPAYQSYCLVARVTDPPIDALFWDTARPYHYIRRVSAVEDRLILVGGCDHRTGSGNETQARAELEEWVRERFDVEEVLSQWSGELFEPTDGLPLIGRVVGKKNVWIATGLSGVGLTVGTLAGELIASEIMGEPAHPLAERLSPARFGLSRMGQFLSKQTTSVRNFAERVIPAQDYSSQQLQPGEGVVGKIDGQFAAMCRTRTSCKHRLSPICVHMGGVVHWNEVEQTWDCPVHGGRYQADGKRMYGPPNDDLQPIDDNSTDQVQ